MLNSKLLFQTAAVALLALAPAHAGAQLLSGSVNLDKGGASVDLNVGGSDGIDADVDVDLGGGRTGGQGSGSGGVDADVDVNIGGGGSGGVGAGVDVDLGGGGGTGGGGTGGGGTGGGGTGGGGTGGGTGGGGTGGGGTGGGGTGGGGTGGGGTGGGSAGPDTSGDARTIMLGNGQPAGMLIGMIVYSSDGVALGVVQDIKSFDGTYMRLAIAPNTSLGVPQPVVMLDMPVSRLTRRELRISMTAADFMRAMTA